MNDEGMKPWRNAVLASVALTALLACAPLFAAGVSLRFDCGTADSPLIQGYQRLTAGDTYTKEKGYGWEGEKPASVKFENPGPLNRYWVPREKGPGFSNFTDAGFSPSQP